MSSQSQCRYITVSDTEIKITKNDWKTENILYNTNEELLNKLLEIRPDRIYLRNFNRELPKLLDTTKQLTYYESNTDLTLLPDCLESLHVYGDCKSIIFPIYLKRLHMLDINHTFVELPAELELLEIDIKKVKLPKYLPFVLTIGFDYPFDVGSALPFDQPTPEEVLVIEWNYRIILSNYGISVVCRGGLISDCLYWHNEKYLENYSKINEHNIELKNKSLIDFI